MSKILISPSILSANFGNMGEAVQNLEKWGADLVHCDVMDGVFVPNITFGMPMIKDLRSYTKLPFDVHLMITEPEKYVKQFCEVGADIVTFHVDASKNIAEGLKIIKDCGKKCGLVLNPDKPLSMVEDYLDDIDTLLLMSVYAGFGGQKFIENTIQKTVDAKKLIEKSGRDIRLEIDGGVNVNNVKSLLDAGADEIVAGSAVFKAENPKEVIEKLRG